MGLGVEETNELLDKIFVGRISTKLLIRRFLELAAPESKYMSAGAGIVDPNCDPVTVTTSALHNVQKLTVGRYNCEVHAKVRAAQRPVFAYPTNHLYFIVFEVLKNAATATVKKCHYVA